MLKLYTLIALMMTSSLSFSAVVSDAQIEEVYCGYVVNRDMCSMLLNKEVADTCNTGGGSSKSRMQFEIVTEMDKARLSMILMAKTTQSTVEVGSLGTCSIFPGISDLAYIEIK